MGRAAGGSRVDSRELNQIPELRFDRSVTRRPFTREDAVSEDRCEQCGGEIPVKNQRSRPHKARFCSNVCRQRAYRRRQAELPESLPVRKLDAGMIREPFRDERWRHL